MEWTLEILILNQPGSPAAAPAKAMPVDLCVIVDTELLGER